MNVRVKRFLPACRTSIICWLSAYTVQPRALIRLLHPRVRAANKKVQPLRSSLSLILISCPINSIFSRKDLLRPLYSSLTGRSSFFSTETSPREPPLAPPSMSPEVSLQDSYLKSSETGAKRSWTKPSDPPSSVRFSKPLSLCLNRPHRSRILCSIVKQSRRWKWHC